LTKTDASKRDRVLLQELAADNQKFPKFITTEVAPGQRSIPHTFPVKLDPLARITGAALPSTTAAPKIDGGARNPANNAQGRDHTVRQML
jgi:hypothetical protein